jgi:hypothetical protein
VFPPRLIPLSLKKTLKKALICSLIGIHLFALVLEVAPFKPEGRYPGKGILSAYLQTTGLWQEWSMFSPDPLRLNVHIEAKVRYLDGTETFFTLPRLHLLPPIERIFSERYRKWSADWLRMDANRHLWADATGFILRQIPSAPHQPVESIRLYRVWHEIEDPAVRFREWGYRIPDSEFTRFEFHSQILRKDGGRK